MEALTHSARNGLLEWIVVGFSTFGVRDAQSAEDTVDVGVHRKGVATQRIREDAARRLGADSWHGLKEPLGLLVVHFRKVIERQVATWPSERTDSACLVVDPDGLEHGSELPGTPPVEATRRENRLKLGEWRREHIEPLRISRPKVRERRTVDILTRLLAQENEYGLRERIVQVPEIS